MEKSQPQPVRTKSEQERRELSDEDLSRVSGGGPHVRVFDAVTGGPLLFR